LCHFLFSSLAFLAASAAQYVLDPRPAHAGRTRQLSKRVMCFRPHERSSELVLGPVTQFSGFGDYIEEDTH
jgi:hypothetical protein